MTYIEQKKQLINLLREKAITKSDIARCILIAVPALTIDTFATITKQNGIDSNNITQASDAGHVQILFTIISLGVLGWLVKSIYEKNKLNKEIAGLQKQIREYQQQNAGKSR